MHVSMCWDYAGSIPTSKYKWKVLFSPQNPPQTPQTRHSNNSHLDVPELHAASPVHDAHATQVPLEVGHQDRAVPANLVGHPRVVFRVSGRPSGGVKDGVPVEPRPASRVHAPSIVPGCLSVCLELRQGKVAMLLHKADLGDTHQT